MSERSSDIGKIIFAPWRAFLDLRYPLSHLLGFPGSPADKESTCNAGDLGLIPRSGRPAGEGIGYQFQDSWASLVAQLVKNLPAMQETWVLSLCWEDPLDVLSLTLDVGYLFPLRRNGVAIMVNKNLKCSTWMQSQKWQNDLCLFPRQTIQYHSNPSICPNQ